uniref:Uncharacterized protein n=1 Tax=Oryza sativa subsp. japonica TaxID=39947 RepID=Q6YZT3_ORYSJ|nr:hypothetical protein [Oryza sativa Japonica Group]
MAELGLRLTGGDRVLTKQRNGGSEIQGAAETVVVGPRWQNSSVDVAGSTQGANCNFERTAAGAASAVRVAGSEDGDAHHVLDRLVLGQKGYGLSQRGLPVKDLWRGFKVDFVQQETWARDPLGRG